jgi:hypothetical protein
MDEQENKIISLDKWRAAVAEDPTTIGAKEEEFFESKPEGSYTGIGALLAAAYMRGLLDGKAQKWIEIRIHVFALIISNFISVMVVWWALSR